MLRNWIIIILVVLAGFWYFSPEKFRDTSVMVGDNVMGFYNNYVGYKVLNAKFVCNNSLSCNEYFAECGGNCSCRSNGDCILPV